MRFAVKKRNDLWGDLQNCQKSNFGSEALSSRENTGTANSFHPSNNWQVSLVLPV